MSESDSITRNAKSNLAFTLMDLPAEKVDTRMERLLFIPILLFTLLLVERVKLL